MPTSIFSRSQQVPRSIMLVVELNIHIIMPISIALNFSKDCFWEPKLLIWPIQRRWFSLSRSLRQGRRMMNIELNLHITLTSIIIPKSEEDCLPGTKVIGRTRFRIHTDGRTRRFQDTSTPPHKDVNYYTKILLLHKNIHIILHAIVHIS